VQSNDLAATLTPIVAEHLVGVEPAAGFLAKVKFRPEGATTLFTAMRDQLGFTHCSCVGGIDWVDHREVFYILWSDARKQYVLLSADLSADQPHIETASGIWPSANWHEREAWEFVGITFDHHPDLRHLLMPDGYAFHPLLRSFKLHEPEDLEVKVRHV
jgi:NADH-quinone oxidoreductase subunit C/D